MEPVRDLREFDESRTSRYLHLDPFLLTTELPRTGFGFRASAIDLKRHWQREFINFPGDLTRCAMTERPPIFADRFRYRTRLTTISGTLARPDKSPQRNVEKPSVSSPVVAILS
uniref:Uncharacterized protein n=1 Tax=Anopheles coluzzii TaxID=1518534 RepID=A0A8W7Q358_ANOCL